MATEYAHPVCITNDGGSLLLVARHYNSSEVEDMVWTFPWERMRIQDSCTEILTVGLAIHFSHVTFRFRKPNLQRNIAENAFSNQPLVWNHFQSVVCSEYSAMRMKYGMWQKFCWIHPHQIPGMSVSSLLRDENDESSPFHLVSRVTQKVLKEAYKKGSGCAFSF